MIHRPDDFNAFEFIVMAAQRTAQLMRGCLPTIDVATQKVTTIAQSEVAAGNIRRTPADGEGAAVSKFDDTLILQNHP